MLDDCAIRLGGFALNCQARAEFHVLALISNSYPRLVCEFAFQNWTAVCFGFPVVFVGSQIQTAWIHGWRFLASPSTYNRRVESQRGPDNVYGVLTTRHAL